MPSVGAALYERRTRALKAGIMSIPGSPESSHDDVASYLVTGRAGDVIFREGDQSAEIFIIQEGRVELLRSYAGEQQRVAVLEAGDFFGEMSLLEGLPREVTARAASDFSALRLDETMFTQVARENAEIPVRMLRRLAHRLRERMEADWRAARIAMGPLRHAKRPVQASIAAIEPVTPSEAPAAKARPAPREVAADSSAQVAPSGPVGPARSEEQAPGAVLIEASSGTRLAVTAPRALVGRVDRTTGQHPDIDLTPFDSARTSGRRHASIEVRGSEYFLVEESQTANGTFVNDQQLALRVEVKLADGDRVRFGCVEMVFRRA